MQFFSRWKNTSFRDGAGLILLYGMSLGIRLFLWQSQVYGDEAVHYQMARTLGHSAQNVHPLFDGAYLFWQRPLFGFLLAIPAQAGFDAYRLGHIFLSSFLPLLWFLLLKRLGVRPWLCYAGAFAIALHPTFVVWGTRVFPDSFMSLAFLAALLFHLNERPVAAGTCLLVSIWIKEVALIGAAALFLGSSWRAWRQGEGRLWPLQLSKFQTVYFLVLLLGPLSTYYTTTFLGARFPGWSVGGPQWELWDGLFLSVWLIPLVAWGLFWNRTRRIALLGLLYPAFYLTYRFIFGRGVEAWYHVLPNLLVLASVALVLEEWIAREEKRNHLHWASTSKAFALLVVGLLTLQIGLPSQTTGKTLLNPSSQNLQMSLAETIGNLQHQGDLEGVLDALSSNGDSTLFLVDVPWFYVDYPFADRHEFVYFAYTELTEPLDVDAWVKHLEELTHATVILKIEYPMNRAIRSVYAECRVYENPTYEILEVPKCSGRGGMLSEAFNHFRTHPDP